MAVEDFSAGLQRPDFHNFRKHKNYVTIIWDDLKRQANLAKHGFDFADFDASFDGETAI